MLLTFKRNEWFLCKKTKKPVSSLRGNAFNFFIYLRMGFICIETSHQSTEKRNYKIDVVKFVKLTPQGKKSCFFKIHSGLYSIISLGQLSCSDFYSFRLHEVHTSVFHRKKTRIGHGRWP